MPKTQDTETLFTKEHEFTTEKVVRIGSDYFYINENGGARGAWQNRSDQAKLIDRAEARRIGFELGYDLDAVAQSTAEEDTEDAT